MCKPHVPTALRRGWQGPLLITRVLRARCPYLATLLGIRKASWATPVKHDDAAICGGLTVWDRSRFCQSNLVTQTASLMTTPLRRRALQQTPSTAGSLERELRTARRPRSKGHWPPPLARPHPGLYLWTRERAHALVGASLSVHCHSWSGGYGVASQRVAFRLEAHMKYESVSVQCRVRF